MTLSQVADGYGTLGEDATLTIQRFLPGPIERCWSYLTVSDLRRQWLASGEMDLRLGGSMELVWRNDELTDPPGERPPGFGAEHRMSGTITELDPPRRLAFTWKDSGDVRFDLEPRGERVLLTVTHRRLAARSMQLSVSAGWHAHLDLLVAKVSGVTPPPFWDGFRALRSTYDGRIPT